MIPPIMVIFRISDQEERNDLTKKRRKQEGKKERKHEGRKRRRRKEKKSKSKWTHLSTHICVLLIRGYFSWFRPIRSNKWKS